VGFDAFLDGCNFNNNFADSVGGAIHIAKKNFYGSANYVGFVDVKNSTFNLNSARHGAAVFSDSNHTFIANNCFFNTNQADSSGGAIYIDNSGQAIINKSLFTNNTALTGGGLNVSGINSNIVITNSTLRKNYALRQGGAFFLNNNANAYIYHVTVDSNSTESDQYNGGGGIYNNNGTINSYHSIYTGNFPNQV